VALVKDDQTDIVENLWVLTHRKIKFLRSRNYDVGSRQALGIGNSGSRRAV